ncbi:5-guanidino-2-oxopentanoate decarboxylase [Marivita sp. XM-24bin2]|jgi:acetolactate synthase-1/2/3 large subunit/5-guanidino-2-oxopentanoate decarboxylase|uniref:5-guanidino-2-oxopentanoate decarboxylase n=1 Tax=unclassified Marivita TaxID=2632480 RepID=UPI000D79F8FA|nr:5-guanidino-2-oxopentanoate decarboxylase [Marivita sp. XM-24bin2]MCR9107258.1 5-guanidino-2-oxopentanoate decarboxylase [Paracoccaceae bacterium]PWL36614.1 MAG: acetolactate synthase isozyme1 large subunit [Marivita sp. XM-24bin2]
MTQQPLGAQISQMLKERGVDTIFGIPGVHNVELYRGIEQAGITHVLARHEQGAGFMADGYARATGKPGVAYVITGPGLTNILTPLGQAYSDSVPVLAISSCLDEVAARRGQLHQMRDQRMAAETVCAWSEEARSPSAAYALIDRAFDQFASARARPCHVQVSIDTLGALADPAPAPAPRPGLPAASHADVYDVVASLLAAKKPLFVFGGGAVAGAEAIPDLLRQTGAASIVTYAARGVVPGDEPLYFGSYLARPDSSDIAAQADLVIAVGTTLSEVDLWRPTLGHTAPMIRVDIDPEVFTGMGPQDRAILADSGAFLKAMTIAIPARTADQPPKWNAASVARKRAAWRAEVESERPGIGPVCDALRAVLPGDTMIFSDMTQFAYGAKEIWDMPRPGHWHHPYGFGTLGYALPAAIGGAVARPGLPTLAIAGDYGLQYTIQELGTAVELGLPLPILVWDNGKLGEIEDSMIRSQIAPNAVVARNPDFLALAKAYGAGAVQPDSLEALKKAVLAAFKANGPTVIRVTPDIAD